MLFEKEKYYSYIVKLERRINYYYVLCIGSMMIIGTLLYYMKGMIIGSILGILISNLATLRMKILIQKMKMEIDIYEKIVSK